MKAKTVSIIVVGITLVMLFGGVAAAIPAWQTQTADPVAIQAPVDSGISYQGRLTSPNGVALNGAYTMRFVVYDDAAVGTAVWDSGNLPIQVANGLFNVKLGVDQAAFNGQALWLSIIVDGQTLSPRQEILPAPYALSLRPGAEIMADSLGAADSALAGYAPATGTAFYADANGGVGLWGVSSNNYGVRGSSTESWGGYFSSASGYGIRVETSGTDHFDHGAYVTAQDGYGVYAQSATNQAMRGEAGDVSGLWQPVGTVGLVGIGASRGVYGSGGASYGVYATSLDWYGLYGRTSRGDHNYGIYTPDNFYSRNYNLAGAMMQVMQNGGDVPLAPGDVVLFSGINPLVTAVDGPIVQVRRADEAHSTAVAGVVQSRFNIEAIDPALEFDDAERQERMAEMEVTPAGNVAPGEYLLVVVQGPALVNASAVGGVIQPGDLLSTSPEAGLAGRAAMLTLNGVDTAVPGTIFGKALEPLDGTKAQIYVYVTLQ